MNADSKYDGPNPDLTRDDPAEKVRSYLEPLASPEMGSFLGAVICLCRLGLALIKAGWKIADYKALLVGEGHRNKHATWIATLVDDPVSCRRLIAGEAQFSDALESALVASIRKLVEATLGPGGVEEVLRGFCRLAVEWEVEPNEYHKLLVGAGLPDPRASEIKRILLNPEICDAFLTGATTWRSALMEARAEADNAVSNRARGLIRRVHAYRGRLLGTVSGWEFFVDGARQLRLVNPAVGTIDIVRVKYLSETTNNNDQSHGSH